MKDGIRMYQNPTPWVRMVCETRQPPMESISSPQFTPESWRRVRHDLVGLYPPPNLQRSRGGRCRGDRTTSVRWQRLQCALCFLFLCFLSFFLLAHLEQNHCTSSGGAVVIPTQGLGRRGKYRSQWSNVDFVFYPKKRNLRVGERIWPSN